MKQVNWFDRKFDFSFQQNIFPSIIERLEGTSIRLKSKIDQISAPLLELKPEGKWSIKENIGHLTDLEPLWQGRLLDILENKEFLRETDLSNRQTDLAEHNRTSIIDLLTSFENIRLITIAQLKNLEERDIYRSALHPRLIQPMRVMDLFLFVAEHDDHHLAQISELHASLSKY